LLRKNKKTKTLYLQHYPIFRQPDENLVILYSQAKENKKLGILNEMLNLLDNRIIGSEIDAPGGRTHD
jgi:hypothetical protein